MSWSCQPIWPNCAGQCACPIGNCSLGPNWPSNNVRAGGFWCGKSWIKPNKAHPGPRNLSADQNNLHTTTPIWRSYWYQNKMHECTSILTALLGLLPAFGHSSAYWSPGFGQRGTGKKGTSAQVLSWEVLEFQRSNLDYKIYCYGKKVM